MASNPTPISITAGSLESWEYFASYGDLRAWALMDGALNAADSSNAAWHYNTHGVTEGRSITFNAWNYLASNADLFLWLGADGITADDAFAAAKHYIQYGANENRDIEEFNAASYLQANADLLAWLGADNYEGAARHYIQSGRFEIAAGLRGATGTYSNDAPEAVDVFKTATEGGAVVSGNVVATDDEGQVLTYAPAAGQSAVAGLIFNIDGSYSFDPSNAAYDGLKKDQLQTVAFNYTVTDTDGASDTETLTITVTGVNDAPVAQAVVGSGAEDAAGITIAPVSSDADAADTATYSVNGQPSNGTVSFDGSNFIYVPNADFNGTDNFTYKVTDSAGATSVASATVTITATNDAPVAQDAAANASEGGSVVMGSVTATDVDSASLTYALNGAAPAGLTFNADGSFSFDPSVAAYNALPEGDTENLNLTYTVSDSNGGTDTGALYITVTGTNDAPVAQAVVGSGAEDTAGIAIAPVSNDVDNGDTATYTVNSQPSSGTVSFDGTNFIYVPDADFNGTDSFTYKVTDSEGATSVATATVTITAANDAPVAQDAAANASEGGSVVMGSVTATDIDSASLTYALNGAAPAGLTFNADGSFSFDPSVAAYNAMGEGDIQNLNLTYTVSDVDGGTDSGALNITVIGTNDAPIAQAVVGSGLEDVASILVAPVSSDVDNGDTASYSVNTNPSHGTVSFVGGNFVYVPNADYNGTDSFTYKVTDSEGATSVATATITVGAVNDAPVATDLAVSGYENTVINGQVSGTDVDGDTLTYSAATATHGTVVMDALSGQFTYTPNANFSGSDSFNYTVSDGHGGSDTETVSITVEDVANVLTPAQDIINLVNPAGEVVLGMNNNLNAGDSITGGAGDMVFLSIDSAVGSHAFSAFHINGVETFKVTSDDAATTTDTSFDLSSSSGIKTLISENSTDDVAFNYANTNPDSDADGYDEVTLQVLNLTEGVNVDLDVRNDDVAGLDELNLLVTDSDDDSLDADTINVDLDSQGVERINLSTVGSTGEVRIKDLNTPGATQLNITTIEDLSIGDTDVLANLANIENALSSTVRSIDASSSTGDVALSTEDSNGGATILGGTGDDTFETSDTWGDSVRGNDGHDVVRAGGGNNTVWGEAGDDTITAGSGDDRLYGGTGHDVITSGAGNDSVEGNEGNDVIDISGGGNDTVLAGDDNDTINAGSTLESGYTENTYPGQGNRDQIDGGAGTDTLKLTGDSGDANELDSVRNVETIKLDGGSYQIQVNDGSWFDTDATATTIDASDISGTLAFDGNDDGVGMADPIGLPVNVGESDDGVLSRAITVIGGNQNDTITTGLGGDSIRGNGGDDLIRTNTGNDTVDGAIGNDNVDLGDGDDKLIVRDGQLDGNDALLAGGTGNDTIELINPFRFGPANPPDTIEATLGDEITGFQTLVVDDQENIYDNNTVQVTMVADYANLEPLGSLTRSVLAIDGSALDSGEQLIVDTTAQDSDGDGIDEDFNITGGSGHDTFRMGGNLDSGDTVNGGAGDDRIVGAIGHVDVDFTNVSSVEIYQYNAGHSLTIGAEAQQGGIVTVIGSADNDVLNATLYTVGLNVDGNDGNDTLTTGSGNDTVDGDNGNDVITTNDGRDTIIMGQGSDSVSAGTGNDTVQVYGTDLDESDTIAGGTGTDTVLLMNSQFNAGVNLDIVTSVERYVIADSGDDNPAIVDADNSTLTFTGGNVITTTVIDIDASALTDAHDTFTVTLKEGQDNADYSFNITGSSTVDILRKENDGVDNNINFQGNGGDDAVVINGNDLGSTVTIGGGSGEDRIVIDGGTVIDEGFSHVSSVERLSGSLVSSISVPEEVDTVPVTLIAGTTYTFDYKGTDSGSGTLVDPDFELLGIDGVTVVASDDDGGTGFDARITFTPAVTGSYTLKLGEFPYPGNGGTGSYVLTMTPMSPLVATLGEYAGAAGLQFIDGTAGNDDITLDPMFTNTLTVNLDLGDDTFDAHLSSSTITFESAAGSITAADNLSGGTSAGDSFNLVADDGTADLTNVTGVELYNIVENSDHNGSDFNIGLTFSDNSFTAVAGNVITVDGTHLDDLGFDLPEGRLTVNAGGVSAPYAFSILGGTGDDSLVTGSGNDTIDVGEGADFVNSGAGNDVITNDGGNNTVFAGSGNDSITLGNGDNSIFGGDGNDTIVVGTGNNSIEGGLGDDNITALGANGSVNTITGGYGMDTMTLGAANDIIRYIEPLDSYGLNATRDNISGFNQGGNDTFWLETNLLGAGVTGINFVGNATDSQEAQLAIQLHAGDGIADIVYDQSTGRVMVDLNDDGVLNAQDLSIDMDNLQGNALSGLDFVLVDTIAPEVPILDLWAYDDTGISSTDDLTNDPTSDVWVAINTTAIDGTAVEIGDVVTVGGGASTVTHTINGVDIFWGGYTQTVPLSEGVNNLSATITDTWGNTSGAGTLAVTLDTVRPTLQITDDEAGVANIAGGNVTYTFEFSEDVTGFAALDINVTNGVKGLFTEVDGDTYTLDVTPNANFEGNMNVGVNAFRAQDLAGNGNFAATTNVQVVDTKAPTLAITDDEAGIANIAGGSVTYTFTFSEAVTGFTASDITVVNGTKGAFAGSGTTYTLVVTPTAGFEGSMTVDVAAAVAQDAALNDNVAAAQSVQVVDTLAPTISIATPIAGDNYINDAEDNTLNISGSTLGAVGQTVTINISDTVGVGADMTVTAIVQPDGTWATSTLDVIALANGVLTFTADVTDAAGNPATQASETAILDNVHPTVAITMSDDALKIGDTSLVTFTFSEAVTGFDLSDVTAPNGGLSGFSGSGSVYTATFTPALATTDLTNVITVGTGMIDIAGNSPVSTDSANYTVDTVRPTLAITMDDTALKDGDAATVTFTFSEDVQNFTVADVTVENGGLTGFAGSGSVYTATFTPSSTTTDATNVITVGTAWSDMADATGNAPASSTTSSNYTVDTVHPTLVISDDESGVANIAGGNVLYTFEFSEDVTGFAAGDVTVVNGTGGTFTIVDANTYTMEVTPTAGFEGNMTVDVAANVAFDLADATGNGNDAAAQSVQQVDTLAPVPLITTALYNNSTDLLTLYGSGFSDGTIDITNLTWDADSDGSVTLNHTFTSAAVVTVVSDTEVTVQLSTTEAAALEGLTGFVGVVEDRLNLDAGFITDAAGNPNSATDTALIALNLHGTVNADNLFGGSLNDTITGGLSNDTINLSHGGVDTVVFGSSYANNGSDTITGFDAGSGGDVLDLRALGITGGLEENGAGSSPFSGTIAEFESHFDDNAININGNVALVAGTNLLSNPDIGDVNSAAGVADLFNDGGIGDWDALDLAAGQSGVVITGATDSQTAYIWHVVNTTGTTVDASEVQLIGTMTLASGDNIGTFHADNFVF